MACLAARSAVHRTVFAAVVVAQVDVLAVVEVASERQTQTVGRILEVARRTGHTVILGSVCALEAVGDAGLALAGCLVEVVACRAPDRVPSDRVVEVQVVPGLRSSALVVVC